MSHPVHFSIPDSIINKVSPLTAQETKKMHTHPTIARELLTYCTAFRIASEIPSYHHERWDGKGYPYKLKGERIPYLARLYSVVDAYDSMTFPRPYKKTLSKEEAIKELQKGAGSQFDPYFVKNFIEMLNNKTI